MSEGGGVAPQLLLPIIMYWYVENTLQNFIYKVHMQERHYKGPRFTIAQSLPTISIIVS